MESSTELIEVVEKVAPPPELWEQHWFWWMIYGVGLVVILVGTELARTMWTGDRWGCMSRDDFYRESVPAVIIFWPLVVRIGVPVVVVGGAIWGTMWCLYRVLRWTLLDPVAGFGNRIREARR